MQVNVKMKNGKTARSWRVILTDPGYRRRYLQMLVKPRKISKV